MKKLSFFLTMMVLVASTWSCSYDDTDLWNRVDDLENRVTALEAAVGQLTKETAALQQMVDNKLYIVSVEPTDEGLLLHLMSANGELSTMLVRNGADGKDGKDGQDGQDGKDGETALPPAIGVEKDASGNYYWTIDGAPLRDATGNLVPVNGTNGQDGKTPTFKIEDGKWYVSFDNGITWTGPYGQATGSDGDAFFSGVFLSEDGNTVRFELIDGTKVTIPLYREFNIGFDVENLLLMSGATAEIPFTVTGATPSTIVEAFAKNGWEADILQDNPAAGILKVKAPETQTGSGRITIIANDGGQTTIMRTLTFVAGEVNVSTTSFDIPQAGGNISVEVTTNLDFIAEVAPESQSWLSLGGTRAYEMRTETINIVAQTNNTPYERVGLVYLKNDGNVIETITVVQSPVTYDRNNIVLMVDPAQVSGGKITLPNLNPATGTTSISIDWGDGSQKETSSSTWNGPSHTYSDTSRKYVVQISGKLSQFQVTQVGITDIVQWGVGPYTTIQAASSSIVRVAAPEPESKPTIATVAFTGASKLNYIDPDFFKGMTALTNMNSTFRNCSSLPTLADGMFDDCTKVTNIYQLFDGCTSLEKVPVMNRLGIENTTGQLQVAGMFRNCKALKEIPENMFAPSVKAKFYRFEQMFNGCESLVTIPADFFKGAAVEKNNASIGQMFYNCKNLENMDLNQFINETALLAYTWTSTFQGCEKLKGTIEPYKLNVGGKVYEVYLWERNDYVNSTDASVKATANAVFGNRNISGASCFNGCVNLTGYSTQIPSAWGGLFDGVVAAPTVKVSGDLVKGQEYYAINYVVNSKNATSIKYLLGSKADYDVLLPSYNNDVTRMISAIGTELDTPYVNAANGSGLTLPFADADPATEYILTVAAYNRLGQATDRLSVTTNSVPKGTDQFESYIGTWKVTSSNSTTEAAGNTGSISFNVTVQPYRVNESYMVTGWGTTIFRDHPNNRMRFIFENGKMNAYAGYIGEKSMWNTIASRYYPYTHETYGDVMADIGMFAYEVSESRGGYPYLLLATPNNPILTSTISGNTISMAGGQGGEIADFGMSTVSGMDIFINTGGMGWSFTRRPAETVLPEYLTTIGGVQYGKYAVGPYTLTRVSSSAASKPKKTKKNVEFIKLKLK